MKASDSLVLASIVGILEVTGCLISIFGNAVVIYVMTRQRKLRRLSNFYIISVSVADLLIGVIVVPFTLYAVICTITVRLLNLISSFKQDCDR